MKTEMRMLENGNYEKVVLPVQHECSDFKQDAWVRQYSHNMDVLKLTIGYGSCCDEHGGCEHEIEVKFCPFCGYQPERLNEKTCSDGFFPPPWSIKDHPEKTNGWIAFQEAMRNDPDYYKMR